MALRQADQAANAWLKLHQFPEPFPFPFTDAPPGWDQIEHLGDFVLKSKHGYIISYWARGHDDGERYLAFTAILEHSHKQALVSLYSIGPYLKRPDRTHMQHMAMAYFFEQALKEGEPKKRAKHFVETVFEVSEYTVRNALKEFPKLRTASRGPRDDAYREAWARTRAILKDYTDELLLLDQQIEKIDEYHQCFSGTKKSK
jgi:hypothetical protein